MVTIARSSLPFRKAEHVGQGCLHSLRDQSSTRGGGALLEDAAAGCEDKKRTQEPSSAKGRMAWEHQRQVSHVPTCRVSKGGQSV